MAGINRPPVPFRAHGVNPKAVDEVDLEYQRTVQEIESGQHQPGWLFGKGAFDKTDLLFIRDHELQKRNEEEQVAHLEANEFAALRKKLEGDPSGSGAAGSSAAAVGAAAASARPPAKRERTDHARVTTPRQLLPIIIKRQRTGEGLEDGGPLSSRASGGSLGSLNRRDSDALGSAGGTSVLPGLDGYGSTSEEDGDDKDTKPGGTVGTSGRDAKAAGNDGVTTSAGGRQSSGTGGGTSVQAGVGGTAVTGRTGSGTKLPDAASLFEPDEQRDGGTAVADAHAPAAVASRAQPASSDGSSDSSE